MSQAPRCFKFIAEALEAETLQGTTAQRVVGVGKKLLQTAGIGPDHVSQLLAEMSPETQQTVRAYFS